MKKSKVTIIVLVVLIVAAAGVMAYALFSQNAEKNTTTATTAATSQVEETQTTAPLAGSVFNDKKTTKKTTQSTTKDKYPFIKNGVWYLADKKNEVCYAFDLKKNGKADVAFFDSDNIEGFDAQYFKGDAKYKIKGKKIIFSKLPKTMGIKSIEFEISKNTVKYNGKKLKNYKKISLDNALKCFE